MIAEATISGQREALKKANNARFVLNGNEYRIKYEGGLAETIIIYGRPIGARYYKYISDFSAYKMYSKEQVVAMAKHMVLVKEKA